MNVTKFRRVALPVALLAFALPAAAQTMPTLTIDDASVVETDAGNTPMTFRVRLSATTDVDVQVYVVLEPVSATPGLDYIDSTPVEVVIDAGETAADVAVQVVADTLPESDETFDARLQSPVGAVLAADAVARGTIVDDEPTGSPDYAALDDRYVLSENLGAWPLDVLTNDLLAGTADGTLTVVQAPAHGTLTTRNDIGPQYFEYRPASDFSGTDALAYRYCVDRGAGDVCDVGDVAIVVRPLRDPEMTVALASGHMDFRVENLRALPSARFDATPLVAPQTLAFANGVDPTPTSPWDTPAGTTWDVFTLPAPLPGETVTRVLVDEPVGERQALVVGIDADGDGQPSPAERGCFSAHATSRCELEVPRVPGESRNVWVLVHNLDDEPRDGTVHVYLVPMIDTDGTLVATGPGHVERLEPFDLRIGYGDDTIAGAADRAGFVTVRSDGGTVAGTFPVFVRVRPAGEPVAAAVPLVDGVPHDFALAAGATHPRTLVDVPAGATRLRVTSDSDEDIDLYLVPVEPLTLDPEDPAIAEAPPLAGARASATGPGGDEIVEVTALINPGRWYVVVRNKSASTAHYTLTAQIDAVAPVVRDGSYFNPDRSGSGLFLYPAGDQWTGLWYTYRDDGTPTWYYLQNLQPGADGVWTSALYRSAWDGDSNDLTAIGHATVTPVGADAFVLTYRLDGAAGSQPYEMFGRGCPLGGAVDVSGTWYDPARAGTGYSVQMFPDYEYYAAYYYDDQGVARFVAAERDGFGGTEAELVIQQLAGDCPTCAWTGAPQREDIGVLRRRILSGQFQYIDTDLEFVAPLAGGWTTTDAVVPLGGPDSLQGCAP